MKIKKIISGGQTGADQGGLFAARDLGIPTGGTAPKHFKTENGYDPWLADYGLVESKSPNYSIRTERNVADADVTLIFGKSSAGSLLTMKICVHLDKQYIWLTNVGGINSQLLEDYLTHYAIPLTINVAGNRESVSLGIQEQVRQVLKQVLVKYI